MFVIATRMLSLNNKKSVMYFAWNESIATITSPRHPNQTINFCKIVVVPQI